MNSYISSRNTSDNKAGNDYDNNTNGLDHRQRNDTDHFLNEKMTKMNVSTSKYDSDNEEVTSNSYFPPMASNYFTNILCGTQTGRMLLIIIGFLVLFILISLPPSTKDLSSEIEVRMVFDCFIPTEEEYSFKLLNK